MAGKLDESGKVAALKHKIDQKDKIYRQLQAGLHDSKEHLEALFTKKGADLLKEWGIFKTKSSKETKETKIKEKNHTPNKADYYTA